MSQEPLRDVIDHRVLQRMAGWRSFARGEEYCAAGQVGLVDEHDNTITANVRGTRSYLVKLWVEGGQLEYSCTCPVGTDGAFCKHCVALGLAWLEPKQARTTGRKRAKPDVTLNDVRSYLGGLDKNALVEMIIERARNNKQFGQLLVSRTAMKKSKSSGPAAYKQAIDAAVNHGGYVDYGSAHDYARGIGDVIRSLQELLEKGPVGPVIELAEYALEAVEQAMGSVDDSDGYMGGILQDIQELHLEACKKAKPDPAALAERLFAWELRTEYDTFYGAAETYAGVLGKDGLAVYRKFAETEWAKVQALQPGKDDPEKYTKRFRITHIMEALARQTGDVEALVAIKKRDLSTAWAYLQIAETYKQARKHDLALEWAERGLKAFPKRTDSRLREFLAEEYHRRKRHDEAMAIVWSEFSESASLSQYQNLKTHADRVAQWPAWREKALGLLREEIARAKCAARPPRWAWEHPADHSELVRIFLWEKDSENAWREAKEGGCSNNLWMELAAKREKDHPEDALPIYQRQIEPTLDLKNNEAYRTAIRLLRNIWDLLVRLGREDEFPGYLNSIRAKHKPKRNFIKLLDHAKWS